jgi:sulfite exporter TauE/SafE
MYVLFVAGILTGFHCLSMCGNFVLGYSLRTDKKIGLINHINYNAARIVSYTISGALLGLLGKSLNIDGIAPFATIAGALFLIFLGVKMLGIKSRYSISSLPLINRFYHLISERIMRIRKSNDKLPLGSEVWIGLLSGFMPCTPLQAAQIYAVGTGDPAAGALAMFSFGLGTVPLLFAYGLIAGRISLTFREKIQKISAVVVLVLALILINRALILLDSPVTAGKIFSTLTAAFKSSPQIKSSEVRIEISNTRYIPSEIRIPENTPVKLIVRRNEDNLCSAQLVIPEAGIAKDLIPFGETVVELPPLKKGVYQVTCQMGMMDGRLIVGDVSSDSKIGLGLLIVIIGLSGLFFSLASNKKRLEERKSGKKKN